MKSISANDLQSSCPYLLDELDSAGVVVTKHGEPVAKLVPYAEKEKPDLTRLIGSMAGEITIKGDILSAEEEWNDAR